MSSVWKRIQRVGKRASKFQFIASYQTLTLECSRDGKWQPNKLTVVWTRRNRRKVVKPETWQPSIANPFRGIIVWTDPEEVEISVTLYKDAREGSPFEDKLWTFVIEDESVSGKRRPVASVSVNMVDYHSVDLQTFCLNLPLRPATKKVISASIELNLACVLLKEGNATDEDMISMSSLLSLNDPYGSLDYDSKNFKRNAGKRLSLRSAKSKSKPTFNMATNAGSPKETKKNTKNKSKTLKNEGMNTSLPAANHIVAEDLNKPMSTSDTDLSKIENRATPKLEKKEEQMSAPEQSLLKWCQECVEDYDNVQITDMTSSWRNGLAFCAIVNHFNPELMKDFSSLKPDDVRENNRRAFEAFEYLGISRMLDPHQMVLSSVPDKLLIMTYLHQIKQYFTTKKTAAQDDDDDNITMATIVEAERNLRLNTETLLNDLDNNDFTKVKNHDVEIDTSKDDKMDTSKGDKMDTPKDDKIDTSKGDKMDTSKGDKMDTSKGDKMDTSNSDSRTVEYKANPGYNPFDEDEPIAEDDIEIGFTPNSLEDGDLKTKFVDGFESRDNNDTIAKGEKIKQTSHGNLPRDRDDGVVENSQEQKNQNSPEKSAHKEPDRTGNDPWKRVDNDSLSNKNNIQDNDLDTRRKPENLHITDNKSLPESVLYSPKPGYNPFLDEETTPLNSKSQDINETKSGNELLEKAKGKDAEEIISDTQDAGKTKSLNPFDDDYIDDNIDDNIKVSVQTNNKPKTLNPFDEDYVEPFETDVDEVLSGNVEQSNVDRELETNNRVDRNLGTSDVNKGLVTGHADGNLGYNDTNKVQGVNTGIDEVGNTSPRSNSRGLQIDDKMDNNVSAKDRDVFKNDSAQNNTRTARTLPKTNDNSNTSSVPANSTENAQVTQMHRKEPRRPVRLATKPPVRKQLTESQIKLKRPESENLGRKGTPTSPTPARGQLSLPTSPRSRIPSFEEWKAKKSDDAAKQEEIKAHARQMIKEARAKTSQSIPRTGQEAQSKPLSSGIPLPVSSSLPRLQSSKKYKAPEPPNASKRGSLASKLKDEIEYQKKITEKTRKTLESSRIKRINPKQENVREVEKTSELSEKVQQAIREAREKTNPPETSTAPPVNEANKETTAMTSPPKPPRVYTYAEEEGSEPRDEPRETGCESRDEPKETGEENDVQEKIELQDTHEENANSSLQQNPFKLTIKKKESVAVVKPLPSTIGRDTKIDLKKYSVKSRNFSETHADDNLKRRSYDHMSSSQESLSDHARSSEEDLNDILDNVGSTSDTENKTDEELYDNGEDEEGFQDTSQYVEHEIAVLEEDRIALDRVAVKLEKELRDAMNTADCKDEEQRLFQEWFLLVNKRNEIVRRQTELSILEKEEDLEKRFELLNRELRFLMADSNREKTAQEKKREELLLAELVRLVNKRDELVRIEDSQVQEAEKAAQHTEHIVRNTKIPKKQAECCVQ